MNFIPYLNAFSYLIQYGLIYSITLRRLNDISAPEWFGQVFLGVYGATSILLLINTLGLNYGLEMAQFFMYDLVNISTWGNMLTGFMILMFLGSAGMIYFGIKDSNPDIDPMHGPSPKYTL